jgi:glycosyltransferase involved in cell wall biosynthesis
VLRALALLPEPSLEYVIVGDGPERQRLEALAADLGLSRQVRFGGALPHDRAVTAARDADLFVLPSVDEAFGVAYVEAMAGGVPAIGCRGEDGPEEIAAAGGGIELVAPRDPAALAAMIRPLIRDHAQRARLGAAARATVERAFTWEQCGRETLNAYRAALAGV